jgi:hypothetical protein
MFSIKIKECGIKNEECWTQCKNWVVDGWLLNLSNDFLIISNSKMDYIEDVIVDLLKDVDSRY